jgi:hypothetical protein
MEEPIDQSLAQMSICQGFCAYFVPDPRHNRIGILRGRLGGSAFPGYAYSHYQPHICSAHSH